MLRLVKEAAADKFRYIMWGTFDEPDKFPPKGEFFCKYRDEWMPEIPGRLTVYLIKDRADGFVDLFHKNEIKE